MLVAHISDLHLGYSQFNLEEREKDVYDTFNEAIDISVREGAKLVILAGDIFHTPRPPGKAIITLANALKKLKEKQIPVVFVLGEHDMSRVSDVPFAYVFSNLGLARRLRLDEGFEVQDCVVMGANKERKGNIDSLIDSLKASDKVASRYSSKKILVLHQGLTDLNKYAGEINSTDLPGGFDYYAMGHYHDHMEKRFSNLGGPLAYPGSIDLTPSEGIKEVEKGFILVDMSGQEPATHWVPLNRRPQFSARISYSEIGAEVEKLLQKAKGCERKPVARIEVAGNNIDSRVIASSLARLQEACLHYVWQPLEEEKPGIVYDNRPADMDSELFRLSKEALGSEEMASFAIHDLLPLAAAGEARAALDIVWDRYKNRSLTK
jgi:DNA repair exonuclease SbcCD nuclease subunit